MAADFDPYYKWLGISPKHQPPHHYRLLGIELFEPDAEVIDAAADRLMTHLQDLAAGEHGEHSQKLLNEIAAARLCLLNPQQKARYDAELKSASDPAPSAPLEKHDRPVLKTRKSPAGSAGRLGSFTPSPPSSKLQPLPPLAEPELPPLSSLSALDDVPVSAPATATLRANPAQLAAARAKGKQQATLVQLGLLVGCLGAAAIGLYFFSDAFTAAPSPTVADQTQPPTPTGQTKSNSESQLASPAATSTGSLPPHAARPRASAPAGNAETENLLVEADQALNEGRIDEAVELLRQYLDEAPPDSVNRAIATAWLNEAQIAASDDYMRRVVEALRKMTPDELQSYRDGTMTGFPMTRFSHPALADLYLKTFERHVKDQGSASPATPIAPTDSVAGSAGSTTPPKADKPAELKKPEPEITDPAEWLASRGLVKRGGSWQLEDEEQVRKAIAALGDLQKEYDAARALLEKTMQPIVQKQQQLAEAETLIQQALAKGRIPKPEWVQFSNQWKPRLGSPDQIAMIPGVNAALTAHAQAHSRLAIALVRALNHRADVEARYRQLADSPRAAEALEALGSSPKQMAPSQTFRRNRVRLEKARDAALTDQLPTYLHEGKHHFFAILNETTVVPCKFRPAQDTNLLPDSAIRAADIEIPADAPRIRLTFQPTNRMVMTRRITIKSLRIGKHKLENIVVLALPPEAEDLGAALSDPAFAGHVLKIDDARFLATLTPAGQ